jgi:hypothetical protein
MRSGIPSIFLENWALTIRLGRRREVRESGEGGEGERERKKERERERERKRESRVIGIVEKEERGRSYKEENIMREEQYDVYESVAEDKRMEVK